MSGTFDKRPDGASRRQTRLDKERKEKRKVRVMAVSVAAVLALVFAGALFINSKLIRRTLPAITIGGVNFSAADYDYFFSSSLNEYQNLLYSNYGDEASDQLPNTDTPLSSQVYNEETGETWADFIMNRALNRMIGVAQVYSAATADRFKLPAETAKEIDEQIKQLKEQAVTYGFPSFNSYIQQVFGGSLTESSLRRIMERDYLISEYVAHIRDSFTFSADELAAYYSENADTLDVFLFRAFAVNAEPIEETGDPEEEYSEEEAAQHEAEHEAANNEALAAARSLAELIASGIKSEDEFIEAAKEYDEDLYGEPGSTLAEYPGSSLDYLEFADWLRDSARKNGDVMTLDNDYGAYVILFVGRDKNEYSTTQMRQILFLPKAVDPSEFDEGEDDPGYTLAVEKAMSDAEALANTVLAQFTEGGATEDKLLELMADNSDDGTEGGFYDEISKGDMAYEIDEWLFEPGRKHGDYKLVKTEQYGYHLVFFMGFAGRACDVVAEYALRSREYTAWEEGLMEAEPVMRWAFNLTQKH